MLHGAELNPTPRLCCAATGVSVCESAAAAEGSTTEMIVDRLSHTIFGYRYLVLKMWYERQRER